MMRGMNLYNALPLAVGAIGNLSELAMRSVAERLLTVVLAAIIVGGVGAFAVTAFAWLWLKRALAAPHALPGAAQN